MVRMSCTGATRMAVIVYRMLVLFLVMVEVEESQHKEHDEHACQQRPADPLKATRKLKSVRQQMQQLFLCVTV